MWTPLSLDNLTNFGFDCHRVFLQTTLRCFIDICCQIVVPNYFIRNQIQIIKFLIIQLSIRKCYENGMEILKN